MSNLSLAEKYRPSNLDELKNQDVIIKTLKNCIKYKNIPHLLFHGSAGIGKTSITLILARELFGDETKNRILELNASDERGIQIVREKIKNFAKFSINDKPDIPPFKIIILDEADALTIESQLALRYIIEHYSLHTRFIIICNYINKIIEPIISRCVVYRFNLIPNKDIYNILNDISINEEIIVSNKELNKIINISNGDLRYSINILEKIKIYNDLDDLNFITFDELKEFIDLSLENKKLDIYNFINNIFINGNNNINLLKDISHNILINDKLNDIQKANILYNVSTIDNNLNNGCDNIIQLIYLSSIIYKYYNS